MMPTMPPDPFDSAGSRHGREPGSWTIIYDADCGFCRWSLAHVLALDRARRLRPVALGTTEADSLLIDLPAQERSASWHLIAPDRRRYSAGAAAPPLLRLLPVGNVPAWLLDAASAPTERAYRWVADHRSLLSKAIPTRAKKRATDRIERRARELRPE
jgi:predicted DCC family thiol-disulfide oxidoreductase YuxK